MKLWQVIQWGNAEKGPNDGDTNIIISAANMMDAIEFGERLFDDRNKYFPAKSWTRKEADAVYLLGEDDKPDDGAVVVIRIWIDHALNGGNNPAWFRHPTDGWLTAKEMYPDIDI